jgi:hypothetical protein
MQGQNTDTDALDTSAEAPAPAAIIRPGEVVIGTIVDFDGQGRARVDYAGNPCRQPLAAVSTVGVHRGHLQREVALLFANGDPQSPVIIGLIHSPLQEMLETFTTVAGEEVEAARVPAPKVDNVTIDGQRVVLEGKEEIVLKCGDASITLTKAGKILIRGKYLMSRSSGVHRILGGSVQVN